jgi:hypothetical protein
VGPRDGLDTLTKDRQCTYNVIFRRIGSTIFRVKKSIIITYSEGLSVSLGIHRETRMRHFILSSLA